LRGDGAYAGALAQARRLFESRKLIAERRGLLIEHLAIGHRFQTLTGTRFQFVPYRGGGPAVQDLVAGQIDIMF
jgi:tripartite-type tricarboxylate transporter receptor subunit TctC